MSDRQGFVLACGLLLLLTMICWTQYPRPAQGQPVDTVAVLSPGEGTLEEVGRLHDESVRKAFGLEAGTLTMNVQGHDHILRVLFRSTGTGSDEATCTNRAEQAVAKGAIALLGPVTSGCTSHLLSDSLDVPIISSLATAHDLRNRSEWFFRTINDDKERIKTFAHIAKNRGIGVDSSIAIYNSSDYGRGLHRHLISDEIEKISLDSTHTFRWENVFVEKEHGEIDLTAAFREFVAHHHTVKNIFVLGSDSKRTDLVKALDEMFETIGGDPNFVLVGSESPEALPAGTWLIGESRVGTSQNIISELNAKDLSEELYIPTLDASMALKRAIRSVLRRPHGAAPLSPPRFRELLRTELANNRFPSSERGRSVAFKDGHIKKATTTPVHRVEVEPHLHRVNPVHKESWVEVNVVEEPTGHLEGPVVVGLIPHGPKVDQSVALQVSLSGKPSTHVQDVRLNPEGTRVAFSPSFFRASMFPTSFSISTKETPTAERKTVGPFGWPRSYPLAALLAVIGALLYARYTRQRDDQKTEDLDVWSWWTYAERCAAGLVIAFIIIHVGPLLDAGPLSQIPIPQFGSSWWVNAGLSGLLGGWLGLSPLVGLAASAVGILAPLFES